MALSGSTVWEFRNAGATTNGGGFVSGASGSDFSQQNSVNSIGNNISTTDAVANGTTTVTSSTAAFTSAIVGNIIYISGSGSLLATAWYQVTAYNSATSITVDRTITTATGLTMNIGGALALSQFKTLSINVSGMTSYCKGGTNLTLTAVIAMPANYTVIGYTAARGDGGQFEITTTNNLTALYQYSTGGTCTFKNVIFNSSHASSTTPAFINTNSGFISNLRFYNCQFTGLKYAINNPSGSSCTMNIYMENCLLDGTTSGTNGFTLVGGNSTVMLVDTMVKNYSGDGLAQTGSALTLFCLRSTFYNNGGKGINQSVSGNVYFFVYDSNFVSNTSDGLTYGGSATNMCALIVHNSIFYNNGGYGININTGSTVLMQKLLNCFFYNNSSGKYTTAVTQSVGEIAGGANPFNNASGGDFSLNQAAAGGALCRGAGWPGILQAGGTGYEDVGAISHGDPRWVAGFNGGFRE